VLAAFTLQKPASWVLAHPEHKLSAQEESILSSYLARLVNGEPLAYITNKRYFFGLEFFINPHVLIPRPETEMMVEKAIELASLNDQEIKIADVGTGSGCIAVALAKSLPHAQITATDVSFPALMIAKQNLNYHNLNAQIQLVQSDLLFGIRDTFHIICANLPYIPTGILQTLDVHHFEPNLALDGGNDGLDYIHLFLANCQQWLCTNGVIFLEIECSQNSSIQELIRRFIPAASFTINTDLAGHPRLAVIYSQAK